LIAKKKVNEKWGKRKTMICINDLHFTVQKEKERTKRTSDKYMRGALIMFAGFFSLFFLP
jgi:hypothetical protein